MRISDLEIVPIYTRRATGGGSQHAILRLRMADGGVGYGEMPDWGHAPRMMPDLAGLEAVLKRMLVGRDPFRITEIGAEMAAAFPDEMYLYSMSSLVRCGVDLALHDAVGRALGQPVYNLLGGKARDRIKVCFPLFRMKSMDQVEDRLETVRGRLAEGFDLYRVYVGGNLEADETLLGALESEFGGRVRIKSIDFSGTLPPKETVAAVERLSKFEFMLVESGAPKSDIDGMAEVRRKIGRPLSEHVYSFLQAKLLAEKRAVDIFNIAIPFIYGITGARKLFHVAEAFDIQTLIGTTQELDFGTSAQAMVGASVKNLDFPCDITGATLYSDTVVKERLRYEDGYLVVPDGVGLGLEIDEEKLAACRRPLGYE